MFWDLNVPYPSNKATARELVNTAIKLGYDGIAWNYTLTRKVKPTDVCPIQPVELDSKVMIGSQVGLLRPKSSPTTFQQKKRLTVHLDDASQVHTLNASNPALRSYDLIAVRPSSERLFQHAVSQMDIDIISIDFSQKVPFYLKRPQLGQAIERGIQFEICYAPAVRDSASRKYLISNAMQLLHMTKCKNILIASEAARAMDLRGPYDAINLGVLFGLKQSLAKQCIAAHAQSVLLHAETRRTLKSAMKDEIISLASSPVPSSSSSSSSSSPAPESSLSSSSSASSASSSSTKSSKPGKKASTKKKSAKSSDAPVAMDES